METRRGIAVSPGVAIGPALLLESEGGSVARRFLMPDEVESELARLELALQRARDDIHALSESVRSRSDDLDTAGDIFDVHRRILEDPKLTTQLATLVRNRLFTPEYAVNQVLRRYMKSLESTGDAYLRQRVRDFEDIEQRLLHNLVGDQRESLDHIEGPVIVVAHDLTPSQTAGFARGKVIAMATEAGGRTSHTAILARALGIPAVVGAGALCSHVSDGAPLIVDGTGGLVVIAPDEATLHRFQDRGRDIEVIEGRIAAEFRSGPAVTRDGRRVTLSANIEFPHEVEIGLQHGAEGVGLYRTEFLFLTHGKPPTEEEHFHAYLEAARALGDRPLTIRVLDLGADKFPMDFAEHNPFLGCRSMRLLRRQPEMFRQQIRAILRVSALADVRFMFPMIATLSELREVRAMVAQVRAELDAAGVPYNRAIKTGVMIEVPSAAVIADTLAREVDFFSIGTNDLIQYTLAVDRNNEHVAHMFSPSDPAVLRLIRQTSDAAARAGIELSMCGEMAGDILYTILLVGLGFQQLSMAPTSIADLKKLIRSITYDEARGVAERALALETAEQVDACLREVTRKYVPELLSAEPAPGDTTTG